MKPSLKINIKYLGLIFSVIMLFSLVEELTIFLLKSIVTIKHSIYAFFWVIIVISLIVYLIGKLDGIEHKYYAFFFLSIILGSIFSLIGYIVNHNLGTENLIKKRYSGVYGVSYGYNIQSDSDEVIEHKTYVFKNTDIRLLNREINVLENKYGESYKRKFYFWQTAFAEGFEPQNISEYTGKNTTSKKITLFFSVGIFFILESLLKALMNSWVIMIIPIIGLLLKKRLFHKELSKLYFKK